MNTQQPKQPLCPFVIVIDSAEQFPYRFDTMKSRQHDNAIFNVAIRRESLGRHPNSKGDYSIYGLEGLVGVERKSRKDGQGTLLGRERVERFESELENLSKLPSALVMVECDLQTFLSSAPATDYHSAQENARTLLGTLMSLQDRFRVPWVFAGSRDFAEIYVFRFLERFYRKHKESARVRDRNPESAVAKSNAGASPAVCGGGAAATAPSRIPIAASVVGNRNWTGANLAAYRREAEQHFENIDDDIHF